MISIFVARISATIVAHDRQTDPPHLPVGDDCIRCASEEDWKKRSSGHFHGSHVDIFVGLGPKGARPFIRKGYGSRSRVTVYLAGNATSDDCNR
jgi:hypothetical protein